MKTVIHVEVNSIDDIGEFKTFIDGDDKEIIGGLACIFESLIKDGRSYYVTRALEYCNENLEELVLSD